MTPDQPTKPLTPFAAALLAATLALTPGCSLFRGQPTPTQAQESPEQLTQQAQRLADAGDNELALLYLRDALEIDPTFTAGFMQLGEISRNIGDLNAAERAFGRAAQLTPTSYDAHFNHADVLQALGRTVRAIRAYLRAVSIRPDEPDARASLASAYLDINEPRQALPHARRAVQLYAEQRAAAQGAIDNAQTPNQAARAHASFGVALSLTGEHQTAIDQYELAAELFTNPPADLFINWANSLGVLQRYDEMENTLRFVIDTQTPSAVAHERLGFALFRQNQLADASQQFRQAIELDPRHHPALNGLGIVLLNQYVATDRQAEPLRIQAISLLNRSLRVDPTQQRIVELVSSFERG